MALPILPVLPPPSSSPVRPGWSIHKIATWNTIVHRTPNGRRYTVPLYPNNPLWKFEYTFAYLTDDVNRSRAVNAPYSDFRTIEAFYNMQKGMGSEFLYQPDDSVFGGSATASSVSVVNNIVTIVVANNAIPGQFATFTGMVTATFLNGTTLQILTASATQFTVALTHVNYGPTADSGTATWGQKLLPPDTNSNSEVTHMIGGVPATYSGSASLFNQSESVQEFNGVPITGVYVNGVQKANGVDFTVSAAAAVAPYEGFTIQWIAGHVPAAGDNIVARYTYYYHCAFSEDTLDFENFAYQFWMLNTLKFEQVRI